MEINVKYIDEIYLHVQCEESISRELYDYFSYPHPNPKFVPSYQSKRWDGIIRLYNLKTNTIYTGLRNQIKTFAKKMNYSYTEDDIFSSDSFSVYEAQEWIDELHPDPMPRDYQYLTFIKAIRDRRRLFVSPTNSGKSLCIYLIIEYLKKKTLLIVPTVGLIHQMSQDFMEYDRNKNIDLEIHHIYEGKSHKTDKRIVISTWQSIFENSTNWFNQFDCIIGDECVPPSAIVETNIGPIPIGEIIDKNLDVKILSYNHKTNSCEWKAILNRKKELKQKQWISITYNNINAYVTIDHLVWSEKNGYIRADKLQKGDIIYVINNGRRTSNSWNVIRRWFYEYITKRNICKTTDKSKLQTRKICRVEIQQIEKIGFNPLPTSLCMEQEIWSECCDLEIADNHNFFIDGMLVHNCHRFKADSLVALMKKTYQCKYKFGFTGTLDNIEVNEMVLEGLFGKIDKVTTNKELIKRKISADIFIKSIIFNYPVEDRIVHHISSYEEEVNFLIGLYQRNNFIANLANSLDGNVLILFKFIEKHGDLLNSLLIKKNKDRTGIYYIHGGIDAKYRNAVRNEIEAQDRAIILASMGTFAEGINIKRLNHIIFATPTKSRVKVLQSIGRGLRRSDIKNNITLFDLSDDLSYNNIENYTIKHYKERREIYNQEQFPYKQYKVTIK